MSRYAATSFEDVCLWSVKAVKWFCHINMSAWAPISSPPSTRWQNNASSVKSSPCLHSVTFHKQTNRDKRQPSSCMSKFNSLKAQKRRKHPATAFHLTTHSFWITLEYMRTPRQWGALPWFLMYDYFIWTGRGRGGSCLWGWLTQAHIRSSFWKWVRGDLADWVCWRNGVSTRSRAFLTPLIGMPKCG